MKYFMKLCHNVTWHMPMIQYFKYVIHDVTCHMPHVSCGKCFASTGACSGGIVGIDALDDQNRWNVLMLCQRCLIFTTNI